MQISTSTAQKKLITVKGKYDRYHLVVYLKSLFIKNCLVYLLVQHIAITGFSNTGFNY